MTGRLDRRGAGGNCDHSYGKDLDLFTAPNPVVRPWVRNRLAAPAAWRATDRRVERIAVARVGRAAGEGA